MTKQDKIQLAVFGTFMLAMVGLVVYNIFTHWNHLYILCSLSKE
jgi:hypothetical protein